MKKKKNSPLTPLSEVIIIPLNQTLTLKEQQNGESM
jgi:hypothetical protein